METLVIVDFQKDFSKPEGSLYVNGSEQAKEAIIGYINKNAKGIVSVIFTVDWHSPNHCSFKRNGGIWPDHCRQFTEGAGIDDDIFNACIENNIPIQVFKKGTIDSEEEYGAFDIINYHVFNDKDIVTVNNMARKNLLELDCFTLTVCGIAGDYCVKNTIDKLIHDDCPVELNVRVMLDGIASIDDGTTIKNYIKENNLKVV